MTKENNGECPKFIEVYKRTHMLKGKDSQGVLCSKRAIEKMEQVMAKADELRDNEIINPDYDAIYLELFGKMKKRKQIPGAGQATGIYFPHASSSSATFAAGGTFGLLCPYCNPVVQTG
ncbi:hypothetical protein AAHA92_21846 [Salvia divinorum]|uniref:Uncharacterized protein n=1 Tax=Salvia divinorum TaxID=28513 RepID=A0ABD1GLR5_SALDI